MSIMKFSFLPSVTLALAVAGTTAQAGVYVDESSSSYFDTARVVRVDPIIETIDHPVRRDECWREPVVYREHYRGNRHDRAPAVVGAIIGGLIGNQFGHGHGRDAATAAGAVLGYTAVRDSQHHADGYYAGGRGYRTTEERCRVRTDYISDDRVVGYDVTYEYRGDIYHTRTGYHPGSTIRVRVDIDAVP